MADELRIDFSDTKANDNVPLRPRDPTESTLQTALWMAAQRYDFPTETSIRNDGLFFGNSEVIAQVYRGDSNEAVISCSVETPNFLALKPDETVKFKCHDTSNPASQVTLERPRLSGRMSKR